ncbi:helix-turn-helix domain-containing protein (plasmid) [Agrobacterium sp. MA01]|uniref:AraC family transcriptional regulator n=1 Tax=Agrobacterium sp. MA01 TaxID=2664893 RepID=UPI00129BDC1C|nr:AraC family transcriptional regulator [Agrobacterium sp. MA01]QGG93284.1 helix-turn-helix domain-containing protein [Agrobacterium sp. MA01]
MENWLPPESTRTSYAVRQAGDIRIETITGSLHHWNFRPHFHLGDEVAQILEGRVRLRLPQETKIYEAGDTVTVPAGIVHRFEPVDKNGWAFSSHFVSGASPPDLRATIPWQMNPGLGRRVFGTLIGRETLHTDVQSIATNCEVSPGYLSRSFRRETGTSLHSFHVLVALQKAKALLRQQLPIAYAALDTGFCDQAHLNREFVRTLGMTPATFRSAWLTAE